MLGRTNVNAKIIVDSELDKNSTNPVQNKVIYNALEMIGTSTSNGGYFEDVTNQFALSLAKPKGVGTAFTENEMTWKVFKQGNQYMMTAEFSVTFSGAFDPKFIVVRIDHYDTPLKVLAPSYVVVNVHDSIDDYGANATFMPKRNPYATLTARINEDSEHLYTHDIEFSLRSSTYAAGTYYLRFTIPFIVEMNQNEESEIRYE